MGELRPEPGHFPRLPQPLHFPSLSNIFNVLARASHISWFLIWPIGRRNQTIQNRLSPSHRDGSRLDQALEVRPQNYNLGERESLIRDLPLDFAKKKKTLSSWQPRLWRRPRQRQTPCYFQVNTEKKMQHVGFRNGGVMEPIVAGYLSPRSCKLAWWRWPCRIKAILAARFSAGLHLAPILSGSLLWGTI